MLLSLRDRAAPALACQRDIGVRDIIIRDIDSCGPAISVVAEMAEIPVSPCKRRRVKAVGMTERFNLWHILCAKARGARVPRRLPQRFLMVYLHCSPDDVWQYRSALGDRVWGTSLMACKFSPCKHSCAASGGYCWWPYIIQERKSPAQKKGELVKADLNQRRKRLLGSSISCLIFSSALSFL